MPRKSFKTDQPLRTLLDASPRPIYAIGADRRIVYCNTALQTWLDLPAGRILGRLVEYHSDDSGPGNVEHDRAGPLTGLCPPPTAFVGESSDGTVANTDRDGRLVHRRAQFVQLDGDKALAGSARRHKSPGGLLVLLAPTDLLPSEIAAELADDSTTDELHRSIRQFRRAQANRYAIESLLGHSSAVQKLRAQVAFAARSDANVLIIGHPGAGRGHVARAIHYHADPSHKLVPIAADTATDDSLRRAFDSVANGGRTLLIERVELLSASHQSQIAEAVRRGRVQARLLATIDADRQSTDSFAAILRDLVSTLTIQVPRLIERADDLPVLAQYFLECANRGNPKQISGFRADTLDVLALYSWPGELDELRSVIAAAHESAKSTEISPTDLPAIVHHATKAAAIPPRQSEKIVLDELLTAIETEAIQRTLKRAKENKTEAAELLGMSRPRLYRRMQQLGLITAETDADEVPKFKPVVDDRDFQIPDFQEIEAEEG